jgi:hypothetical protein
MPATDENSDYCDDITKEPDFSSLILSGKRVMSMCQYHYSEWLKDLPSNVEISTASDGSLEIFFLTGSFCRFKQQHGISDIKVAILMRKWLN